MNALAKFREAVKVLREHPGCVFDERRRVAVPIARFRPKKPKRETR